MTEEEWSTTEPADIRHYWYGHASPRTLRLLVCAWLRQVWHWLVDERSRRAIELAERLADGEASEEEQDSAREAAWDAVVDITWGNGQGVFYNDPIQAAADAAAEAVSNDCDRRGVSANEYREHWYIWYAIRAYDRIAEAYRTSDCGPTDWKEARAIQYKLMMDILGSDPSFRLTPLKPLWRTWNRGTVLQLAQAICSELCFDDLPILADALEEAGCDRQDILAHCRGPGPHVRGCWALDVILGKN
jgi:hypothetical protein